MYAARLTALTRRLAPAWLVLLLAFVTACPPDAPTTTDEVARVVVSPDTATVTPGENQAFTANVVASGAPSTEVSWSLVNAAEGDAISDAGVFSAGDPGDEPRLVTVVATSVADASVRGTAAALVPAIDGTLPDDPAVYAVVVAPGAAWVDAGDTHAFTAEVLGLALDDTTVTWSLDGAQGDDAIATDGTVTAGEAHESDRAFTVVATSNHDDTKSGSATVIVPGVAPLPVPVVLTVTVAPPFAWLNPDDERTFTAEVWGTHLDDTSVTWSLDSPDEGDALSSDGVLALAPSNATERVITITATSVADDTRHGTATVVVGRWAVDTVTVTADPTTMESGGTATLTATVNGTNLFDTTVAWTIEGGLPGDTIDENGTFTAGDAVSAPRDVTLVATANQDGSTTGSAMVTITPSATVDDGQIYVDVNTPNDDDLGPLGSQANPYPTISAGLAAVAEGGTVHVAAGTYVLSGPVEGFKTGVTLLGASPDLVHIDATDTGSHGLLVRADDVTLYGFTVSGAETYNIKTSAKGTAGSQTKVSGLTIENVVARGAVGRTDVGGTEIDLNNVSNARLIDVIADGFDALGEPTKGVGVSLVSADDVVFERVHTEGNAWGGVGMFSGRYIDDTPDAGRDITIDDTNTITEGIYLHDSGEAGLTDFGYKGLAFAGVTLAITNSVFTANAHQYVWFAPDAVAVEDGLALLGAAAPYTLVRFVATDEDGHLQPTDDLLVVEGMSVQHAVSAAAPGSEIHVGAGTYALAGTLDGFPADAALIGAGRDEVVLDASSAASYGLHVRVDGVRLEGFTLHGAGTFGIKTGPRNTDGAKLEGLTIEGVTVRGSGGSEIDLNSVVNAHLIDVLADGDTTSGVGVALTNVDGVVFEGVTTRDNAWGGVGLFSGQNDDTPDAPRGVSIDESNHIEDGIYIDDEHDSGILAFGDNELAIPWIEWMVTSASFRVGIDNRGEDFVRFARDAAERDALVATLPSDAVVRTVITNESGFIEPGDVVVMSGMDPQVAIDAAPEGATVALASGTFAGPLTITKGITLQGAGADLTIIEVSTSHDGITVTGASESAPATIAGVAVVGTGTTLNLDGFDIGSHTTLTGVAARAFRNGIHLATSATDIRIEDCAATENTNGLRVASAASIERLIIEGCHFDDNAEVGIRVMHDSPLDSAFNDVAVRDTTFSANGWKGMYFEKLSNALFEDIVIDGSGIDEGYGFNAGIDVNLKYGDYSGVTFRRVTVVDSGVMGIQTNPFFPVAMTVKARDDGAPYGGDKAATLDDVLIDDCVIAGVVNGLGFGEPDKLSLSPTNVVVVDSDLSGGTGYAAVNNATVDIDATSGNTFNGVAGADVTDEVYDGLSPGAHADLGEIQVVGE